MARVRINLSREFMTDNNGSKEYHIYMGIEDNGAYIGSVNFLIVSYYPY